MANELALLGGTPVLQRPLQKWIWPPRYQGMGQLAKDYIDNGEPLSIQGRDGVIALGEDDFKVRLNRRHAILCSSGTMAIDSGFLPLGFSREMKFSALQ